jgi:hypothetical protein
MNFINSVKPFVLFFLVLVANSTFADSTIISIKPNGSVKKFSLNATNNSLTVKSTFKGNSSELLDAWISAPYGTKVEILGVKRRTAQRKLIPSKRNSWKISTISSDGKKKSDTWIIKRSSQYTAELDARSRRALSFNNTRVGKTASFSVTIPDLCTLVPESQINELGKSLSDAFKEPFNKQKTCEWLNNQVKEQANKNSGTDEDQVEFDIPTPTEALDPFGNGNPVDLPPSDENPIQRDTSGANGYIRVRGLLQKDACASDRVFTYDVFTRLTFDAVDKIANPNYTVEVALKQSKFTGRKASSIKPISDGKFAPRPLLLMSTVSFYNESINAVSWKSKPTIVHKTEPSDYVYYRGFALSRTPANEFLRGGRGTFEKVGKYSAYGVCFDFAAKRQRAFGYP